MKLGTNDTVGFNIKLINFHINYKNVNFSMKMFNNDKYLYTLYVHVATYKKPIY